MLTYQPAEAVAKQLLQIQNQCPVAIENQTKCGQSESLELESQRLPIGNKTPRASGPHLDPLPISYLIKRAFISYLNNPKLTFFRNAEGMLQAKLASRFRSFILDLDVRKSFCLHFEATKVKL
jgi:hypothetical protein